MSEPLSLLTLVMMECLVRNPPFPLLEFRLSFQHPINIGDSDFLTLDLPCDYGDGTIIPREYLEKMEEIVSGLEVDLLLGEGEILLVDNFQVSHGRKPWKGDRRILVSLWEGATPIKDFEVF